MAKRVKRVKVVRTKRGVKRVRQKVNRVDPEAQAKQAANKSLVTVEDSTIQMILADPRYTETIPCLQNGKSALASVGKRCGRCTRRRNQLRKDAFNQLKSCIAGLRGTQAKSFKKLLGAKRVRVYQTNGRSSKPVPITF